MDGEICLQGNLGIPLSRHISPQRPVLTYLLPSRDPTPGNLLTICPRIHVVADKYALFPTWSELGVVDILVLERVFVRDFTTERVQFSQEWFTES